MTHTHDFSLDETIYNDGPRQTVKTFCACGAMQREIETTDRYGVCRKTVVVAESDGRLWRPDGHRHSWMVR